MASAVDAQHRGRRRCSRGHRTAAISHQRQRFFMVIQKFNLLFFSFFTPAAKDVPLTISFLRLRRPRRGRGTRRIQSASQKRRRRATPSSSDICSNLLLLLHGPPENAPGDYRFINRGHVRGESFFAAVVLRRNAGKDTTLSVIIHLTTHV